MNHLHRLFSNAYILGGSPCSGKSTVAEILAARYNLPYYKADDFETEHFRRSQPDRQANVLNFPVVVVDGAVGIQDQLEKIIAQFRLGHSL